MTSTLYVCTTVLLKLRRKARTYYPLIIGSACYRFLFPYDTMALAPEVFYANTEEKSRYKGLSLKPTVFHL
jgi:hypothetical protein